MHRAVLLKEVVVGLALKPGEILVDATLGGGGHGAALCRALGSRGWFIGFDRDEEALIRAKAALESCPARKNLFRADFRLLEKHLSGLGLTAIDALLFDLGWSSDQLEQSGRGFSFRRNEPLRMTYENNPETEALTAEEIVNRWSASEIARILEEFGEERFAPKIAAAIVEERKKTPLKTTGDLVRAVFRGVPDWYKRGRIHPATKTFQALRIVVNDELEAVKEGLAAGWRLLRPGGRLAVISFHSLEARLVKDFFRERKRLGEGQFLTAHAIKPTREEVLENRRARSAQLRIIKKS